jgi:hypothetical protein
LQEIRCNNQLPIRLVKCKEMIYQAVGDYKKRRASIPHPH